MNNVIMELKHTSNASQGKMQDLAAIWKLFMDNSQFKSLPECLFCLLTWITNDDTP